MKLTGLLFGAALVVAGCSGSPDDASPSPSVPAPGETTADTIVDITDSQGSGGDFTGALSDVTAQECAAEGDTWLGTGTLTNSASGEVDYRVYVAFLNPAGDTVGLVQGNVDAVAAGGTGEFAAQIPFTGDEELTCVLRIERYDVGAE